MVSHGPMKKLLLLLVDACNSKVLISAMNNGTLPNFRALANTGILNSKCTAVFPSLMPTATVSLVTGYYPKRHNIAGFHWYDLEKNEVVYYGNDFWIILNQGLDTFYENLLVRLNHQRLQADTLFQTIERAGLKTASLNYLIFRGEVQHQVNMPLLLGLLPGVPFTEEVYGPSLLYFGDLVRTPLEPNGQTLNSIGGPLQRLGFNDNNTANLLLQLVEKQALPDFTLAYFPDNDLESHKLGPKEAIKALKNLDQKLGDLFRACGGLKQMLKDLCIIVVGDHSQSEILATKEAGIRLDEILRDFGIAKAGKPWGKEDQLVICPEMRSAQIYLQHPRPEQLEHIVALLLADRRIDQVIWRAKDSNPPEKGYYVSTLETGRLRFWPGLDGPQTAIDQYGCSWSWEGPLETVNGHLSDNSITFPTYPNAFERLVGALDCANSGHIWVTARPGYEFQIAETKIHRGGGSHGSLHVQDSTSPLIIAGLPEEIELPEQPRTVDIASLCLTILSLEPDFPMGASHI
jgi:hypothetical protein